MKYGYARVSTDGQSLDAQVKQLRAAGAEKVLRAPSRAAGANLRRSRTAPAENLEHVDVALIDGAPQFAERRFVKPFHEPRRDVRR